MSLDLHQFARPFDIEAYHRGDPLGCAGLGFEPQVLKTTEYYLFGTVTSPFGEVAMRWDTKGNPYNDNGHGPHNLVMLPLFLIDGKPVFVGDEIQGSGEVVKAQSYFSNEAGLWKWPGAPRKVETRMTGGEIGRLAESLSMRITGLTEDARNLLNFGIARAIEDGDVIPAEYFFGVPGAPGQTVYGSREAVKALEAFFLDCVTASQANRWIAVAIRRAFAAGQHSARSGTEHGMMYFETLLLSVKEAK